MKQTIVLFFLITFFYGNIHSQEKFELSRLLNGEGLNEVVTKYQYLKRNERIIDGDTLRGYLLDNSKFTFLGNPVGEIEIHETNGLVHLVAFNIEKNELDGSHVFDGMYQETNEKKDQILEGAGQVNEGGATAVTIEEIEKADQLERSKRKAAIINFINNNTPITQKAISYLNEKFGETISDPQCQFDCRDIWHSEYAEIMLEKNNFYRDDDEAPKVLIDQTLGIILPMND